MDSSKDAMRDLLKQYHTLQIELSDAKKSVREKEDAIARLNEEGVVKDKVYGGMGGIQGFVIEGFPERELNRRYNALKRAKTRALQKETELIDKISDIESFIDTIEDGRARVILKRYYLEGKKQYEIASELFIDRSLVSKIITKYV